MLMIFVIFDDYRFCENQLVLKKSISRGSSGQSANLKMTAYRSSNSEVLTVFDDVDAFLHQILATFLKKHFSILSHIKLLPKEYVRFFIIFLCFATVLP